MARKIGSQARLIQPVIQGTISEIRFNQDAEELEYHVDPPAAEGQAPQSRWLLESQLEDAPGAAEPQPGPEAEPAPEPQAEGEGQ